MQGKIASEIIFRTADKSDNNKLILLNSLTPMNGKFSLLIDRSPDFFRLLEKRGKYHMYVAEKNNEIIASCSVTEMKTFVDKNPFISHYVSDFRVHPDFFRSTLSARFGKYVYTQVQQLDAKLMFATIVLGNKSVMPFLSGRWLFPEVFGESLFNVYQLIPVWYSSKNKKYKTEISIGDDNEIFRTTYLEKFAFYTDIYKCDSEKTKIITAKLDGKTVAAIALTDTENYKKEILKKAPRYLEILSKIVNLVNKATPIILLPRINEPLRILYIRFISYSEGHEAALKLLISEARKYAYQQKYHFLSIGLHDRSEYNRFFKGIPKFTFKTKLFFSTNENTNNIKQKIENGCVYWDFTV